MEAVSKLRVSLLQMDVKAGDPEANFSKLHSMLKEAVSGPVKPDLVVFPEMWNTGYALERISELADANGVRTKLLVGSFCREHGIMALAGSVAVKSESGVRNTVYVFGRNGQMTGEYSKIHLFRLMEEEKALVPGERPGAIELDGIPAATMICYDIRFPELARTLALEGAKLLVVPAEWPNPRMHHWRTLLTARAIENQMYVVACNRVGVSGHTEFFGHSMVIDPWGEVVVEGGEEEGILSADLNLELVDEVRGRIPVFEDRRPSLYR
jgi:omega-amidase